MPIIMPLTEATDPPPGSKQHEIVRENVSPIPSDGLRVPDGDYIEDPDKWFRDMEEPFEDRIKHKK